MLPLAAALPLALLPTLTLIGVLRRMATSSRPAA
jgi:hypothetical protein